jgi:hypothetical protein
MDQGTPNLVDRKPGQTETERSNPPPLPLIDQEFPTRIVWRNVGLFLYLHAAALFGLGLLLTGHVQWRTVIWGKD